MQEADKNMKETDTERETEREERGCVGGRVRWRSEGGMGNERRKKRRGTRNQRRDEEEYVL